MNHRGLSVLVACRACIHVKKTVATEKAHRGRSQR